MIRVLALLSLVAATVALVRSVFDYQGPGRMPLADLLRDRFRRSPSTRREILTGIVLGVAVVGLPLLGLAMAGWLELDREGTGIVSGMWILSVAATVALKVVWAAAEELIFRGAVLVQLARFAPVGVALVLSALLFACAHLSRTGDRTPGLLSFTVLALDGIGFGVVYLATRSLWLPTAWHAAKNLAIWFFFGESTMQLTASGWQVRTSGPELWVGAHHQAGAADAIVTGALVLVVVVASSRRIRA
jgi:membrane protease YdiL (CAAX protease family)